jgi:hypothetical protein
MPYFERLPYLEMVQENPNRTLAARTPTNSSSLVEYAAAILKEQSALLPRLPELRSRPIQDLPGKESGRHSPAGTSETDRFGDAVLLQPRSPVKAGQTAKITISVVNDLATGIPFRLIASDLACGTLNRLAAGHINFSPRDGIVAPFSSAEVQITVRVPESAVPGRYAGPIDLGGNGAYPAILAINVEA